MNIKNRLVILVLVLFTLFSLNSRVQAASPNNPFQVTLVIVEQMITNALAPLNNLLDNHEQRIAELEDDVQELEARIEQLEATPTPTITPTPIVTPTPDLRPFDATLTVDGTSFTIMSNKIITDCRYSSTSIGGNISVSSGNLANGTNTCVFNLLNSGWTYTVTVKDETGDTKSFSGTV